MLGDFDFFFLQLEKKDAIVCPVLDAHTTVKSEGDINCEDVAAFIEKSYWENYTLVSIHSQTYWLVDNSTIVIKTMTHAMNTLHNKHEAIFYASSTSARRTMAQITCRHSKSNLISFCCRRFCFFFPSFVSSFSSSNSLNCFFLFMKKRLCDEWVIGWMAVDSMRI